LDDGRFFKRVSFNAGVLLVLLCTAMIFRVLLKILRIVFHGSLRAFANGVTFAAEAWGRGDPY